MTEEGIRFKKYTAVRTASAQNWLGTEASQRPIPYELASQWDELPIEGA